MALRDTIEKIPMPVWVIGAVGVVGILLLMRGGGGGSTTLPGTGQTSDLTDALAALQDQLQSGQAGGGGTTTPAPPVNTTNPPVISPGSGSIRSSVYQEIRDSGKTLINKNQLNALLAKVPGFKMMYTGSTQQNLTGAQYKQIQTKGQTIIAKSDLNRLKAEAAKPVPTPQPTTRPSIPRTPIPTRPGIPNLPGALRRPSLTRTTNPRPPTSGTSTRVRR